MLLLDEAFAALGPALKTEMLDLTRSIAEASGATILMVTHDPQIAAHSQRTIHLRDGLVAEPEE